jgi:type IV pilus assembly protein PilB
MTTESTKRLGELLLEAGIINTTQQRAAIEEQRRWGGKFGSILIEMGFTDIEHVLFTLENQHKQKCISLKNKQIPLHVLSRVKVDIARKYNIMPLDVHEKTLVIATAEPNNLETLDNLSFILGLNIKPMLAVEFDIRNAIKRHYD